MRKCQIVDRLDGLRNLIEGADLSAGVKQQLGLVLVEQHAVQRGEILVVRVYIDRLDIFLVRNFADIKCFHCFRDIDDLNIQRDRIGR